MSMRALGRSSARRGLAPALRKEHDLLKIVLITMYRGVSFEDVMAKYSSVTESVLAPSISKVLYPIVTYFAFHLYLLYICSLAVFKEVYERTVIGGYLAAWVGRLAEQYNAWQESRLPRIVPPPIRVKIDEDPKLQPASPAATLTDGTAAAAAAAAAEASGKTRGLRSSPNTSPRGAGSSESASSLASSSSLTTSPGNSTPEGGGASSSLSSLTTTSSSVVSSDDDDDEKDAVPFPFSADPAPRSSPRASLESSDESRGSASSSAVSTPDFATPPQSPMPTTAIKRDRDDDVSEKTGEKEDNVGVKSDPADSLQMPAAPVPAHFPPPEAKKKDKKKKKKPDADAATRGESEEDEMTGQKEGDDSERAAKRRLEKMEKRLKKERESLRQIRAKKKAAVPVEAKKTSLRKINEDKSRDSGSSSKSSGSSQKRKQKTTKNQFAKKVARADSIRQRRDSASTRDKKRESERKKNKGSKRDKKGETKKDK